jgi:hypothetical protein
LIEKVVRAHENIAHVQTVLMHCPGKSVKQVSQELGLKQSSTLTIMRKDLKILPCKIQMQQALTHVDENRQVIFCHYFNNIWKTTPHLFTIDGTLTKPNSIYPACQQTICISRTLEMPLHPENFMVWCSISLSGIVKPIFLNNIINAELHILSLQDHTVSTLQAMGINTFPTRWGKTIYRECGS